MRGDRIQVGLVGWLIPAIVLSCCGLVWGAGEEKPVPAPAADASLGSYWLGVLCMPVDELLKTHLKIEAGVVVEQVVPDSPAAKAGVRENDILLKFGDVKVMDVESLMKCVAENKDREAKLVLLRAGKETQVSVKPAMRPSEGLAVPLVPGSGDWTQITDWMMKRLQRGQGGGDPLSMLFVHPGVAVPKELKDRHMELFMGPPVTVQLPKDTSVTIRRQGDQPAKIVVQRGEQKWELTEGELDKLPEDLRPPVKAMLGGTARVYMFGQGPVVLPGQPTAPAEKPARHVEPGKKPEGKAEAAPQELGKVREKLEEMNRQLRENERKLQRQMDELRQQLEKMKQQQI